VELHWTSRTRATDPCCADSPLPFPQR
jgi:hypothetical protein